MATTTMDSGLGEALAPYQPKVLSPELWDRFRDDAIGLVVQLPNPSRHRAIQRLSRLAVFLADVAPARPKANLAELLTREQIDGFLARETASPDKSKGTVDNYRAALNALLAVREGRPHRQPRRRERAPHLEPYSEAELIRVLAAASSDASSAAFDLARAVGCVLAGVQLPSGEEVVHVSASDGAVDVAGQSWTAPVGMPLPDSGPLDAAAVARGRKWARKHLEIRLDLRRLDVRALTAMAATAPATRLLALPGVGRARLDAAVAGASRPEAKVVAAWLRGA